jgi:signal transduction histidine kinase
MTLSGLRPRVTMLVAAVVVVGVGIAFIAVYRGTAGELTQRSEGDLRGDLARLESAVIVKPVVAASLVSRARHFLSSQPFEATQHVTFVKVPGEHVVSNQPELLGLMHNEAAEPNDRVRAEARAAAAFLSAPPGFSVRVLPDAGKVRVLVSDVRSDGRVVARLGVGEPTAPADRSREVVLDAFLIAGGLAIAVALAGGFVVASRVAGPLRRMARVAAEVDAGEMGSRMAVTHGHAQEVKVLGDAFDHMLDRLQEAFDRQSTFVADASHELRTPLTVISGQVEVLGLEQHPDVSEVHRVTAVVRREVQRMARLVDDMLLLAQAGEDSFLQPSTIEVPEFLEELASGMGTGLRCAIEIGPHARVKVRADPDRLTQALRNLLRNAVAHADGRVVLGAEASAGWVRFTVDDDGPGIPASERDRVFDRFHRIDFGRSGAEGGAGLGLAIVRVIAAAHGGRAWAAESRLGGAQLVVELPL